ncbi:MAG: hypothetical protein BWY89_01428 [Bacteroidetes bacterium ADurb.BinA012]|nr:MAG: hypothetical protein BWY89_01428 [Bacteroidetes bacterium ADurb.BinA012]
MNTLSRLPTRFWYISRRYSGCDTDPIFRSPKSDHVTDDRKATFLPPALIHAWYVCSSEADDQRAIASALINMESPVEKRARRVWKSMTPPRASLPYMVAPGPKMISVRSMMFGSIEMIF